MTEEEVLAPLKRFYEEFVNKGDLSRLEETYHPDYINHAAPFGLDKGVAGLRKLLETFIEAFPDQHIEADFMFAKGDLAIAHWTITGTHLGTYFGVPATGKKIRMTGIDIERVVDGKIIEHWGGEDMMLLLSQIGAIVLPKAE